MREFPVVENTNLQAFQPWQQMFLDKLPILGRLGNKEPVSRVSHGSEGVDRLLSFVTYNSRTTTRRGTRQFVWRARHRAGLESAVPGSAGKPNDIDRPATHRCAPSHRLSSQGSNIRVAGWRTSVSAPLGLNPKTDDQMGSLTAPPEVLHLGHYSSGPHNASRLIPESRTPTTQSGETSLLFHYLVLNSLGLRPPRTA